MSLIASRTGTKPDRVLQITKTATMERLETGTVNMRTLYSRA